MLKHDLVHEDNNRHAKVDRRKSMKPQPYTEKYRQLRNAEMGRNSLPQLRKQQLVTPYQIVNPKNIHTNNITRGE